MHPILFLTSEEMAFFDALPEEVRHGWHVAEEEGTAYETADQITANLEKMQLPNTPEMREFQDKLARMTSPDPALMESLPEAASIELLSAIGACGICALIEDMFHSKHVSREMLSTIAFLGSVRHRILLHNSVELTSSSSR